MVQANIKKEQQQLRKWLEEDFKDTGPRLFKLCVDTKDNRPLYLTHVQLALKSTEHNLSNLDSLMNLQAGYVYLTAAYYAIDALVDEHGVIGDGSKDNLLSADVGVVVTGACSRLTKLFLKENPQNLLWFSDKFRHVFLENSQALREEFFYRQDKNKVFLEEDEFFSMWARSNTFIFLFEICYALKGHTMPSDLEHELRNLLYYLQWGDDIGDWREDFRAKKWTPFLRSCFTASSDETDEKWLEKKIYLDGKLEYHMGKVIEGLAKVKSKIPAKSKSLLVFVDLQLRKAKKILIDFLTDKISEYYEE